MKGFLVAGPFLAPSPGRFLCRTMARILIAKAYFYGTMVPVWEPLEADHTPGSQPPHLQKWTGSSVG